MQMRLKIWHNNWAVIQDINTKCSNILNSYTFNLVSFLYLKILDPSVFSYLSWIMQSIFLKQLSLFWEFLQLHSLSYVNKVTENLTLGEQGSPLFMTVSPKLNKKILRQINEVTLKWWFIFYLKKCKCFDEFQISVERIVHYEGLI